MSIRSGCGKAAQVAPTLGYRPVCFDKLQNGPDPQGATRDRDRPAGKWARPTDYSPTPGPLALN